MMEFISLQALEIGSERRRELALDAMRAGQASGRRIRRVAGTLMVAIGERIAGERIAPNQPAHSANALSAASGPLQTSGDCI